MSKRLMKGEEAREKARDDAVVEISLDEVLKLPGEKDAGKKAKSAKAKGKAKAQANGQQVDSAFENSDEDSEVEAQERQLATKGKAKGVKAFEQRDLVALAFAGDNVVQVRMSQQVGNARTTQLLVQDFEKLKQREIDADAPREEDHTLPGWVCIVSPTRCAAAHDCPDRARGAARVQDPTRRRRNW